MRFSQAAFILTMFLPHSLPRRTLFLIANLILALSARAVTITTDVCVYGGTSGGVIAAVHAARLGKTAVLVEASQHMGGMTSGGLGATDQGNSASISGMSREFYNTVGAHYGSLVAVYNFEPHVAIQIYQGLCSGQGVSFKTNQRLASVQMTGTKITQITMDDGTIYVAKMYIDATYEGDLMAAAGVTYTVGRESTAAYGESLAGIRGTTPQHQFTVATDPYVTPGNPSSGLLPYVQSGGLGTPGTADSRVQAYNYRLCLTQASNKIAITAPNYNAANYELLGRYIAARVAHGDSLSVNSFFNITSLPNGKTDFNNNGAFSTDFIGQNYTYPTASYATRATIAQAHTDYTLGLIHFLSTDSRVPAAVQTAMQSWGFCADEFGPLNGFSPQLYVREARRMISAYIMQQGDCQGTRVATDPIALASYTMDSHNCERIVQSGSAMNEGDTQVTTPQPFPISYRSIVPSVGQAQNLLVPWSLSASHIGFASIRMEPVFMMLGHSAATAACLAIDNGVTVQALPYSTLQQQLIWEGQLLTWGGSTGIVLDNTSSTGVAITGAWTSSTSTSGYIGTDYLHDGDTGQGTKSVRYTPTLPKAGFYEVDLHWTQNANRATNVPVDINYNGGTTTVTVNQQQNGGMWVPMGSFNFVAGTAGNVLIRTTGANGYVIADAVRFIFRGPH